MHYAAGWRDKRAVRWPVVLKERWAQAVVAMAVLVAASIVPSAASAAAYSQMIILGDSLSDTGNAFLGTGQTIPPSPPYFEGHFSNGPVWVERLAVALGVDAFPFLAGGTNFAFGSAQTRDLLLQLSLFLSTAGFRADPEALYVIWGGASDIRQAVRAVVMKGGNVAKAIGAVRDAARRIAEIAAILRGVGAKHFLVLNQPDIGLIPETTALGHEAVLLASHLTHTFNQTVDRTLNLLQFLFRIDLTRLDTFALLNQVVNREFEEFTNVTDGCLDGDPLTFKTDNVCSPEDRNEFGVPAATGYVFWDNQHPTTAAHALLTDEALKALGKRMVSAAEKGEN
jgi:phospholipase/lecithinase/hemolysin